MRRSASILALATLTAAGYVGLAPARAATTDARVVDNPDSGRWDGEPRRNFQLLENLLLGSEEGDDAFGRIASVAVDSRGRIIVLDGGFVVVKVYDPDAMTLTSFGRKGQGPGEFNLPTALGVDAEDRIYVASQGGRVAVFSPQGELEDEFRHALPGGGLAWSVKVGSSGIYLAWNDPVAKKIIHRYDPGFHYLSSFSDSRAAAVPMEPAVAAAYCGGAIDLDAEGFVYFTQMTPYEIRKFSPAGELMLTIHRENDFMQPPRVEKSGDGMRFHACAQSTAIIVLRGGMFMNIVRVPLPDSGVTARTIVDLFDGDGVLLKSRTFQRGPSFRCVDGDQRVYAVEDRDYPMVIRYELQLPE